MEMSPGDLLDRHSILLLRREHGDAAAIVELKKCDAEAKALVQDERIALLYVALMDANKTIWGLESAIRQGKSNVDLLKNHDLSDPWAVAAYAQVGMRALEIRQVNGQRISAKNAINKLFDCPPDVKVDHASRN